MARSSIYPPSVQPGKPRLPPLPAGWSSVAFGDILEVVERPAKLKDDQEYQLVTAKRSRGGIVPRERLFGRDILTKTQFYVREGDFLISNRQIIHGGCGIVPPSLDGAIVSNEYTALRPKPSLSPDYLRYLPHTIFFQQTCFHASVGVDVEKMVFDIEQWLSFKVHLPPLLEQNRIAEFLFSADDVITATRELVGKIYIIKESVLKRLLANGLGHDDFKKTDIGEIPKFWNVIKISDAFEIQLGKMLSKVARNSKDQKSYLRNANVQWENIDASETLTMSFNEREREKFLLRKGDLLVCEGGEPGRCAIWDSDEEMYYQKALHRIRSRMSDGGEDFLKYVLMDVFRYGDRAAGIVGQNSIAHLTLEKLRELLIPWPNIDERNMIVRCLGVISAALVQNEKTQHRLERLQSTLLSDLLSGRKRVPMAEHAPVG